VKTKKRYICSNCGSIAPKWSGQCYDCGSWSTIEEEIIGAHPTSETSYGNIQKLEKLDNNIAGLGHLRTKTSIEELNRVLGGGLVAASVILIGGDPGIGKSTLLLQLAASLSDSGTGCLYVSGEESVDQIKLRAVRLGIKSNSTHLLAASNVEDIISTIHAHNDSIKLVIIDSIQTMISSELPAAPGTVSQIKASSQFLINYAKSNGIILLIACHVTKEGQLAGPKILEHMVDTVLYFEGDHNNHFRILRGVKNRFGSINEIGVFEMTSHGLVEVSNPSELFLMERENNVSGSAVFAGIEGSRPLLIELQALTAPSNMATPRRSVVGWDLNRLSMILAVLSVRLKINLSSHEVYLSVAGGLKIVEPAADMAVAAALISAVTNKPLPLNSAFFGEIGLSGEIRKVSQSKTRIAEAQKLGFDRIICSKLEQEMKNIKQINHLYQLKAIIAG
jgi:DNA repair protein RadA/Sms